MIGIISDTHNNRKDIERAVQVFKQEGIKKVFHCGDFTEAFVLDYFKDFEFYFVVGNMDKHPKELAKKAEQLGLNYLGEVGQIDINAKKIALFHGHYAYELNDLIKSQEYDYIFTGHTHERRNEKIGKTQVINPGGHAIMRTSPEDRTLCLLDVDTGETRFIRVDK